ncbi:response regulator transcription factor [Paenibacillus sp. IB182496]|uniref:Response regulator transcription factor n=1 Tax=Paenibacillus sabuli TaxID=2772509 RepID=A0A927GSP1_9BACL|nr:response regulator transcription factor [Paenibacillus sabuli]MBD2846959.1 response regulator transcription factor [Paenibacillus sabuli]
MNDQTILVVDDELEIAELIGLYLRREGYDVYHAASGDEALRLARELEPQLIVLDIQLGEISGIEVCEQLRRESGVPILFVSCRSDDTDIIHGLSVGGDDYITKPFSPRQLVARVQAHLRRVQLLAGDAAGGGPAGRMLRSGELEIDPEGHTVTVGGRPVSLSAKEFDLLVHLARHPGKAFPLDRLYRLIWGTDSIGDTRTLMVHISNLRKKIEADPANPAHIVTVRGVGYKFISQEGTS